MKERETTPTPIDPAVSYMDVYTDPHREPPSPNTNTEANRTGANSYEPMTDEVYSNLLGQLGTQWSCQLLSLSVASSLVCTNWADVLA